ncbi:hypothetical protein [Clostridium sp.]|uniref:hypothetical protein n=1 Tax=Clostridium sp. TaxID=1506 RepID=UPI002908E361|nr:hypothetical protein [Clostridium sp.]MDU3410073.1 hypothetical protein [Clostridium sp.]
MDRSDLLLVSLGGGGNRLADTIMNVDQRFHGLFINTSITDIESLENYNPLTKNFMCISQQNGVGRNRKIGKGYAEQYSMSIAEKIMKYQQETIYLISSLGGGSGSSILTTTLQVLQDLKNEEAFDKIINLICIIPDIKSPSIILENALETWDEIFQYKKLINSMIFIDNSAEVANASNANDKELLINERFAELFDSIFDIPDYNGVNFDNGNLGNVLKDKGCLYIYDLPSGKGSIEIAMRKSEQNSVLAKIYKSEKNTVTVDNENLMRVGYMGISLNDENYDADSLLENYAIRREPYIGGNEEKNLVLISGCLPPNYTMEVIELELDDRSKNDDDDTTDIIYHKSFSKNKNNKAKETLNKTTPSERNDISSSNKKLKKVMKKNLFKRD